MLLCAGVTVHPDAALSEREPEGLDVSAQPPGAAGAQPVSGYLPPNSRSSGLPAQQRAHAQGPEGEHAHVRFHHNMPQMCMKILPGMKKEPDFHIHQSKHCKSNDLINEVNSEAVNIATLRYHCRNRCARPFQRSCLIIALILL